MNDCVRARKRCDNDERGKDKQQYRRRKRKDTREDHLVITFAKQKLASIALKREKTHTYITYIRLRKKGRKKEKQTNRTLKKAKEEEESDLTMN